ncbi:MAG TPA: CehA/McbA family metallohydrolase [Anaerolineae bacterium]|nr:CehA/McbA family metallohydrolase [Anaerolineae bacterium]
MMPTDETGWREYAGHIHFHTTYSDGTASFADIVHAAHSAGVDFAIATDHNLLVREQEGYHGTVLILAGQEVHDTEREPEVNHLLAVGAAHDVALLRSHPQKLMDAVRDGGGLTFLAHPIEHGSRLFPKEFSWIDWNVHSFDGLELWNFMSECKAYVDSRQVGLLLSFLPQIFVRGPWPETLALWDRLNAERPVVAIGGSDNHGGTYHIGPLTRTVFPYTFAFQTVNTHVLAPEPLDGMLPHDRKLIFDALREGHCWVGYDLLGRTTGFRFQAHNGSDTAIMGDRLALNRPTEIEAFVPARARLRLLRNGLPIGSATGRHLRLQITEPGVYRVEAFRRAWGRWRGWIFSNPIYVHDPLA